MASGERQGTLSAEHRCCLNGWNTVVELLCFMRRWLLAVFPKGHTSNKMTAGYCL